MYYVLRYTPIAIVLFGIALFLYHIPQATIFTAIPVIVLFSMGYDDLTRWMARTSANATAVQVASLAIMILAISQGWRALTSDDWEEKVRVVTTLGSILLLLPAFAGSLISNSAAAKHRNK